MTAVNQLSEAVQTPVFTADYAVSFGDCDPVGIVFYPRIFAWLDRTFHAYLTATAGGHKAICNALNARGTGLMNADCQFRSPLTEGDTLSVDMASLEWRDRAFQVNYEGHVEGRLAFKGTETRALFVEKDGRMTAGDIAPLKAALE
ncbi:MAG: acyl-CoA thioesterase, partial [Pseudomonadota bacterium]